jgi:hypothetical protein
MAKNGCGPFEPSGNFLAMGEGDAEQTAQKSRAFLVKRLLATMRDRRTSMSIASQSNTINKRSQRTNPSI